MFIYKVIAQVFMLWSLLVRMDDPREYVQSIPDDIAELLIAEFDAELQARMPPSTLPMCSPEELQNFGYLTLDLEAIGSPRDLYDDDILETLDDMLCHPEKYVSGLLADPDGYPDSPLYLMPWSFTDNPIYHEALRRNLIK
ncbi:hypothetical protein GOV10_02300 [Candidatus Woesearchaeota archaeon]|nr:hypothetical protein [Candidatus Woesearchaeota archaeon]